MRNIGIKGKILGMILGICALFGIALTFVYFSSAEKVEKITVLQEEIVPKSKLYRDQANQTEERLGALRAYLLYKDDEQLKRFEQITASLSKTQQELLNDPTLAKEVKDTINASTEWRKLIESTVFTAAKEGNWEEATALAAKTRQQILDIKVNFTNYRDAEDKKEEVALGEIEQSAQNMKTIVLIALIVCTLLAVALAFWFAHKLVEPIQAIDGKLRELSSNEGDLTARLDVTSNDEIGAIATSFNQMLDNLQDLVSNVKETAVNVKESSEQVNIGTSSSMEATTEMAQTMSYLATGVQQQVASIQESSVAMDEMAIGVQRIAESASTVAELAVVTSDQANDGKEVIEQSLSQMTTIHTVVGETSDVVHRLVTRMQQIDKALESITTIADQTNLLALNAAIESARAGEHGRGFAVVADEVRKLAEQSKQSALEITTLIQQIHTDTKEATVAMERGQNESMSGMTAIREAEQAFSSIVGKINEITYQVQEVSATAEEMSAGAEEVNAALSEISSISKDVEAQTMKSSEDATEQTEVMKEMAATSQQMTQVVEELEKLVVQLKTN
ncbi:methyl-accepting chemotaxis protein [Priestia taiwanensis]|uniref:Chemotaxis protein n=1 Tax=Priestia taiwanensis TaxID=1347902 RepID=A0A917AXX3_9BACI|nr:methyl-accepting chemotaxis protein [Priestia taiwanensis]MBM7364397.1 methyl-accepting chemotaxis protein [Priestia taiwanensis]GGE81717.1 chemotaxis protein [Priestia taiwanensis]